MDDWSAAREALAARIARFVDGSLEPAGAPEPFEALALDIHRWQVRHDPVLAALVTGPVDAWTEIPAVPVGLFRDLPVGTFRSRSNGVVFRTSGTTGGRGEHHLRATDLYDRGAVGWARRCVPGLPADGAALLQDVPDSSLSHMVRALCRATWHVRDGVVDRASLAERLRASGAPLFLAATAFALAEALQGDLPPLPAGSVLMITGGFKGRAAAVDAATLVRRARAALAPARVVEEYGMTELSSQLWGGPGLAYQPPPWLRVTAVDADGRPVGPDEIGQLRFVDLCNLDSTLAIETMDAGRVGPYGVELHGRLVDAEPRGCSLTVEEAWARRNAAGQGA